MSQPVLWPEQRPAKQVRPTIEELRSAITDAWLEVRHRVSPKRFRETIRGHEKDCADHTWRNLEAIWRQYAQSDRGFVVHLRARPEVYGAGTPELITRFEALAVEHDRAANRWAGLREWVRQNDLPAEFLSSDTATPGSPLPLDEHAILDEEAHEDPLIRLALATAAEADRHLHLLTGATP